jgi:hypothetical protein
MRCFFEWPHTRHPQRPVDRSQVRHGRIDELQRIDLLIVPTAGNANSSRNGSYQF